MKLLLDQNLSIKLCFELNDIYPSLLHVRALRLDRASDRDIWSYARENGCTIVSKDRDFLSLAALQGAPPKIVWLQVGNCATREIASILRRDSIRLHEFHADKDAAVLILRP